MDGLPLKTNQPAPSRVQGVIVSIGQSGTTWLRYMLAEYFISVYRLHLTVDLTTLHQVIPATPYVPPRPFDIPFIFATHAPPDDPSVAERRIVLLRHPLDVIVARYFQIYGDAPDTSGMYDYATGPDGLATLRGWLNAWCPEIQQRADEVCTYESLRTEPAAELRRVVAHFGLPLSDAGIARAVELGRLDRMAALEDANRPVRRKPGRRIRRGKVGGFRDYFSHTEIGTLTDQFLAGLCKDACDILLTHGIMPLDTSTKTEF
jgi:hypothetical protein